MRGDFKVDGFALHDLDWLAAKKAGDHKLLDFWRCGDDGGKSRRWIGTDGPPTLEPRALQVAERNLRQSADRAVRNCDCATGRLGHRRHSGAERIVGRLRGTIAQRVAVGFGGTLSR